MPRELRTLLPCLTVAALVIGLATPAFADIPPNRGREPKTLELEPHRAPPMTPPPEDKAAPETPPEAPAKAEPEPEAEVKPETKPNSKKAEDSKTSSCSIDDDSERNVLGLAALILLISGASLRRRRRA